MNRRGRHRARLVCFLCCVIPIWPALSTELETNNIPHTLAELNEWYVEPPTNQNGATYFLEAADLISRDLEHSYYTNGNGEITTGIKWPFSELLGTNAPLSPATKTAIAPYIKGVELAWPTLERAASSEQSRYPTDLSEGWDSPMTYQFKVRVDSAACALFALSKADAKQEKEAGDGVLMTLAVARSLESAPLMGSQDVRWNCLKDAVKALQQTVNRVSLSNDSMDELKAAFDRAEQLETEGNCMLRALTGNRLLLASYFDLPTNRLAEVASDLIRNHWITNYTTAQIPDLIAKGLETKSADRKYLNETFDQMIGVWKQGPRQRLKVDEVFSSRMSEVAKRQFGFTQMVNLEAEGFAAIENSALVNLRLAQTALALERYRAVHENQYPKSLDSLVPEYLTAIRRNVFEDSPVRYDRHGNGYTLSCARPAWGQVEGPLTNQIVFRVINPPGRAIIE